MIGLSLKMDVFYHMGAKYFIGLSSYPTHTKVQSPREGQAWLLTLRLIEQVEVGVVEVRNCRLTQSFASTQHSWALGRVCFSTPSRLSEAGAPASSLELSVY